MIEKSGLPFRSPSSLNFEKKDRTNTQGTKTNGGLRCCHPHDVSAAGEEGLGLQISILEHARILWSLTDAGHALQIPTTQEGRRS